MGLSKASKVAVVVGGLVVAMSATAVVAAAQSPTDAQPTPETPATTGPEAAEDVPVHADEDCIEVFGGIAMGDLDKELPQEMLDELNQEGTELAAAFDAAGITYEIVTDPAGVAFPEWDWSDEAANDVADGFFESRYGTDKGFFAKELKDLPAELIEELSEDGRELAAALDAAGITYEMVTDPAGVAFPEWDWDDEAANEVADAFFEGSKFGDSKSGFMVTGEVEMMDFGMDLPQEVIDDINSEGAALAAALDEAGVSYELVTDPAGVTFPEWNGSAGDDVAKKFFGDHECAVIDLEHSAP